MRFECRASARRPEGVVLVSISRVMMGLAIFVGGVTAGCSDGGAENGAPEGPPRAATPAPELRTPAPDALDALYARDHVVEVVVELDPADWEALRGEGRDLADGFLGEEEEFAFNEYVGAVSVDGQQYENVTVRKKGYLGSLSRPRPSLKLDFGEVEDAGDSGRVFERLTLNNNRQDYSRARTCLAYDVFASAGIPTPRCNLAHVVVNGEDLGTYSNVEPVKKPLLARHFGDASGALYEGQLVDFVEQDIPRFQLKTNDADDEPAADGASSTGERRGLRLLATALEARDAELPQKLGEILDLPRFREFWAAETLTGHWDGYAGNRNNFYVYENPASGRIEFIPWGTDGAFAESIPGETRNTSATVYARGLLANRLYRLPEERAHFRSRLGSLNDLVWDAPALTGELERITALAPDALPGATAVLEEYLRTHGARVRTELSEPAPEWVESEPSPCYGTLSDVTFDFETDYGDLTDVEAGLGDFAVGLRADGVPLQVENSAWFGRAGVADPSLDPTVAIRAVSSLEDGRYVLFQVSVPPEEFTPGRRPLHGFETAAGLLVREGAAWRLVGFVTHGTLQLDAASTVASAEVSGRLEGKLLQLGCAALE